MNAAELRARQAPLKDQYRQDPASARIPIGAHGDYRDPGVTCTVEGWAGATRAGLHHAAGGEEADACSGDMLLEALLACAGVTLRSVATALSVEIGEVRLRADGYFDIRGTLGIDRSTPVGVQDVVITIEVKTDANEPTLERLATMTERYCVVGQSLRVPPVFEIRRIQ
jgi:uncharacterized OsmC-like protein